MAIIILEKTYDDPSFEYLSAESARTTPCLQARGVRWLRSYFSADRKRAICLFEAESTEDVRQAYRSAGADFDSAWVATVIGE